MIWSNSSLHTLISSPCNLPAAASSHSTGGSLLVFDRRQPLRCDPSSLLQQNNRYHLSLPSLFWISIVRVFWFVVIFLHLSLIVLNWLLSVQLRLWVIYLCYEIVVRVSWFGIFVHLTLIVLNWLIDYTIETMSNIYVQNWNFVIDNWGFWYVKYWGFFMSKIFVV
jgi:hypothetical protein